MAIANAQDGDATADAPMSRGAELASSAQSRRERSALRVILEVALIGIGVFLGLMGEQWRERAQHRELAQESLRRFHAEFVANRNAVAAVRRHHIDGFNRIRSYLRADTATRAELGMPFRGTHPAFLEYAAWDVALATQSLVHVDSDLAHAIAHVYSVQRQLDDATRDITHVMYLKTLDNLPSLLSSMAIYFGDCNLIEPRLLSLYDAMLLRLDRALGRPAAGKSGR